MPATTMRCIDCNVELVSSGSDFNRYLETDRCIECALRFRYCPQCGAFMLRSDMRNDVCKPCFKSNPVLADYGCRVDAKIKLGNGKRFFGVELETEVVGASTVKEHLIRIDEIMGDNVIMKRDGSLRNGIEIVTRPATLEKQYLVWNKFLSQKHTGLVSWNSDRTGMHVHVSKAGLPEAVIAKAVCFVNASGNKKFMYVIAGRKDNGYAKYKTKSISEAGKFNGERHEAINLGNEATIEFRLFKGTLKKESVYKNIEFCDAILEYCGQEGISLTNAMSRAGFVRFVRQSDRWPHLLAFIMCRWFGKETELSNQIGWTVKKNCSSKNEAELSLEDNE